MPYLLHDHDTSTRWSQERVQLQPNAVATAELFSLLAQIKLETACSCLTKLAGRREPLEVLRSATSVQLQNLLTEKQVARVLAGVELGRRMFATSTTPYTISTPTEAIAALSYDLSFQSTERFAVLVLDTVHRLVCTELISVGTATATLAHPREVFGTVLRAGGIRCIVAHNHPSGNVQPSPANVQPSPADLDLTRELLQAGKAVGIPVLDHLILGQGQFSSIRESTTLWEEVPQDD